MHSSFFRRSKNTPQITPSKTAAAHTAQNFTPRPPEKLNTPESNVVASEGHHLGAPKPKRPLLERIKERLRRITKKQWIIIGIVGVMVLAGIGTGLYFLLKDNPKPVVKEQKKEKPAPGPVVHYSNLTGLQIDDPSINDRPVTAIMVENSVAARPQAGLDQAGVVFEAIAEGGITRLIALYQDTEPDYIGPVRSVRPYYVQWAMGFDAAIAHVGGSPDGLSLVRQTKDLDQFAGAAYFWRVTNRSAPHNVYTSIANLREYENKKGYGKANYTSLARKTEAPSAAPNARSIDLNVSSANYKVHYDYDQASNSYKRSLGGSPHTDERSGAQLMPKTVVALMMEQGSKGQHTTYNTLGSGSAIIFQDGFAFDGTWKKDGNSSQFTFANLNGDVLMLNPGQTWFTIVGSSDRISYVP